MKLIISVCLAAVAGCVTMLAEVYESPLFLLRQACATGNLAALEQARRQGVNVNARDNLKQTPLMLAAANGQAAVIKRLVELGADTSLKDKDNYTALEVAVDGNQAAGVAALLECGVKPSVGSSQHAASLAYAAWLGNCEMVAALLNHGADPNIIGGRATPLREAMNERYVEAAILLLEHGADPALLGNRADQSPAWTRNPPLIDGAYCNNVKLVQMLLDRGADINARSVDRRGTLPLINAAYWNALDVMPLLLEAGADINATTVEYHVTALVMAVSNVHIEVALWLIGRGADVEIPNLFGYRAIHFAACDESDEMLRALIKAGAKLETKTRRGRTALMFAASHGWKKNVALLTQAGADANARDNDGLTALMYVCFRSRPIEDSESIIELLVNAGADINATDNRGETAYAYAADRGNLSVTAALKKRGAKPVPPHLIAVPPRKKLSPAKRWILAVAAIYKQSNRQGLADIYASRSGAVLTNSADDEDFNRKHPRESLEEGWGIKNREAALKMLQWLARQGHRQRYQETGRQSAWRLFIRKPSSVRRWRTISAMQASWRRWGNRSALAWDLCRQVNLACDVYAAGYVSEEEFWRLTLPVAQAVQKNFASWREMGENHLDGRQIWNGGIRDKRYEECFKLLANPDDPNSPWNQLPWDTPLTLD
ncbi:MAG: ankyrin repeat domain-containing protein [Verrucomicrobiales bacterium]|nr:ankyrin repeat domain-containing protein [Verrucomicrobiales bacterium]